MRFVNSSLNERTFHVGLDPCIRAKETRAKIYSLVSMIKEERRAILPHLSNEEQSPPRFAVVLRLRAPYEPSRSIVVYTFLNVVADKICFERWLTH